MKLYHFLRIRIGTALYVIACLSLPASIVALFCAALVVESKLHH